MARSRAERPIQNEVSRLDLYTLEEEARRYVRGDVRTRTKGKMVSICFTSIAMKQPDNLCSRAGV